MRAISFFLVFSVFFSSMFVTNDVSLIIFVPLTIMLFKGGQKEKYILPVIIMENIAAIRGSMLTPFGSPQNLFLFGRSGVGVWKFILHMLPLWALSAVLLCCFICFLFRKDPKEAIVISKDEATVSNNRQKKIIYLLLFLLIVFEIVSRTKYWYIIFFVVLAALIAFDRKILLKTDYVLILTFFCFFVFSSSITANQKIAELLSQIVAGREYFCGIILSQFISNVPVSIVLYPFTENLPALLYAVDTAGLCTIIGSLASVINYRIYVKHYPDGGKKFMSVFTKYSLAFLAFVIIPGYLLSFWGY